MMQICRYLRQNEKEEDILQEERNVPLTNVSVCKPLKDPVTSL